MAEGRSVATVTARGTGSVRAVPDLVELGLQVVADAPDQASAYAAAARAAATLDAVLDRRAVPADRRATGGVTVTERWEHRAGRSRVVGHRATVRVALRLDAATPEQVADVAAVLGDAVRDAGALPDGLEWRLSPGHPATLAACATATRDAAARARAMADALGLRVGEVLAVRDVGGDRGPVARPMAMRAAMAEAAEDGAVVTLSPDRVAVEAAVEVSYGVSPAG